MSDRPAPEWDSQDVSVLRDQRAAYDEQRERCPVAYSDFLGWSLFRHKDIVEVLANPAAYSSASHHLAVPNGMDPPEHSHYRRALEPCFTPEWMVRFEPACRRIATALVQTLVAKDEVDIVDFSQSFTLQSLCAFLGWSPESWEYLQGWTHGNQEASFSRDREASATLAREFAGFVTRQLQVRRESSGSQLGDDLTTSLVMTTVEGEPLTDEEIVSLIRNWTAGHGTVASALGIVVHYLAEHPDMQQQLRDEPSLLSSAIDEILRTDGPLVANHRTATRDVEIGGRNINVGEKLSLMWIAANRDERAFDDPEDVRIDRDPGANLLFGAGIHICMGAPLARLEMRVAMEELLHLTTAFDLSTVEPASRQVYPANGFDELRVSLTK